MSLRIGRKLYIKTIIFSDTYLICLICPFYNDALDVVFQGHIAFLSIWFSNSFFFFGYASCTLLKNKCVNKVRWGCSTLYIRLMSISSLMHIWLLLPEEMVVMFFPWYVLGFGTPTWRVRVLVFWCRPQHIVDTY